MELVLVGLSHKTAPVEVRERLAIGEDSLPEALRNLHSGFSMRESLIISTCNRVEVIAHGPAPAAIRGIVRDFLSTRFGFSSSALDSFLYSLRRQDLVKHVFRVASSLDSLAVGEPQILGQLKNAYGTACQVGSAGTYLNSLMPRAFFVAKRVRTETRIAQSAISVSSVAVELARKIFGDLKGKHVLLLGAGQMSELAAQSLLKCGIQRVFIANRTDAHSRELAGRVGGTVISFADLDRALVASDIVIVSTSSREYLLNREQMQETIRKRKNSPLFIVDISVPRNVDPAVNEIESIFLYDIDDLQSVIDSNLEERRREAESAEKIVAQEVENYFQSVHRNQVGPLIGNLRSRIEEICLEELEGSRSSLSQQDYQRLERAMLRAAHRIAHPLIMEIKRANESSGPDQLEANLFKKLLDLYRNQ